MKLRLLLHSYIVDTLSVYGDFNDVVNMILDASDEGHFDICNKPECESREGCSNYDVIIRNETYLSILKTHGVRSKTYSLRRLLYWFVDNEIYERLGWQPIRDYISKNDAKINKVIDRMLCDLNKLEMLTDKTFDGVRDELNSEWRN